MSERIVATETGESVLDRYQGLLVTSRFPLVRVTRYLQWQRDDLRGSIERSDEGLVLPFIEQKHQLIQTISRIREQCAEWSTVLEQLDTGEKIHRHLEKKHGKRANLLDLQLNAWLKDRALMKLLANWPAADKEEIMTREKNRLIEFGAVVPFLLKLAKVNCQSALQLGDEACMNIGGEAMGLLEVTSKYVTGELHDLLDTYEDCDEYDSKKKRGVKPIAMFVPNQSGHHTGA